VVLLWKTLCTQPETINKTLQKKCKNRVTVIFPVRAVTPVKEGKR